MLGFKVISLVSLSVVHTNDINLKPCPQTSKPKITNFRFLMNATDSERTGGRGTPTKRAWVETITHRVGDDCNQFKSWQRDMSDFWILRMYVCLLGLPKSMQLHL